MKILNKTIISSQSANVDINSSPIDLSQTYAISAQVNATATIGGTLQLQVSNDIVPVNYEFINFTPTNWSNLGSAVTLSGAGANLIARTDTAYRALRAVFTDTFARIQTIVAVADVVGSLNSKYFLASSKTANYYFWFSNGGGVDPLIAGRTGVPVVYVNNDSAATLGGLIRTAAASKGWTVTGASATAILTCDVGGAVIAASDGAAPTGFGFTNTVPTGTVTVNLMAICV